MKGIGNTMSVLTDRMQNRYEKRQNMRASLYGSRQCTAFPFAARIRAFSISKSCNYSPQTETLAQPRAGLIGYGSDRPLAVHFPFLQPHLTAGHDITCQTDAACHRIYGNILHYVLCGEHD